jgi:RHS repeat-associated protein
MSRKFTKDKKQIEMRSLKRYQPLSTLVTIAIVCQLGFSFSGVAQNAAPTRTQNYVLIHQPVEPATAQEFDTYLTIEKKGITVKYFDGLGRPSQAIKVAYSPDGQDIVQGYYFDSLGRESLSFLPYELIQRPSGEYRNMWKQETEGFYVGENGKVFTQTEYDNSPLNRVTAQVGPGQAWRSDPANPRKVRFEYGTNGRIPVTQWSVLPDGSLNLLGNYSAGSLRMQEVIDEDGRKVREWKDMQGKVVLKEAGVGTSEATQTHYVYDDYDRLRWVIPPQMIQYVPPQKPWSLSPSDDLAKRFAYYYRYDGKGRVVAKQLPGADPVYFVYDQGDRVVLTQDGKQRSEDRLKWTAAVYDSFGRVRMTGVIDVQETTPEDVQSWFDQYFAITNSTAFLEDGILHGQLLTQSWYDGYSHLPSGFDELRYQPFDHLEMPSEYSIRTTGMPTAQLVTVLNPEEGKAHQLLSAIYYDKEGRTIQTVSQLYDGGIARQSNRYSWSGLITAEEYRVEGSPMVQGFSLYREADYDHAGRLLQVRQRVNDDKLQNVSLSHYDALGRLSELRYVPSSKYWEYGSEVDRTVLQVKEEQLLKDYRWEPNQEVPTFRNALNITYRYNIRGWLTDINDVDNAADNLFALRLNYTGSSLGRDESTQYTGNIGEALWTYWNAENGQVEGAAYAYSYDALNRLTRADWHERNMGWTGWNRTPEKYDTQYQYDKNGNITDLLRFGKNGERFEMIDYLKYFYNGNQLMRVNDERLCPAGYADNNTAGPDFSYDANGNMYQDMDRSIHIDYNQLNLPQDVESLQTGERLRYVYTATGTKLASLKINQGSMERGYRYVGPLVFEYRHDTERWELEYASVPEGRLVMRNERWVPQFALKDHLGNVRALIEPGATTPPQMVWQQPGYYPFGMALGSTFSASEANRLMYNGKELQNYDLGGLELGWYDYHARFYDPAIARWHTMDPLAEKTHGWSPYRYAFNNPVRFIDPKGLAEEEYHENSYGGRNYTGAVSYNMGGPTVSISIPTGTPTESTSQQPENTAQEGNENNKTKEGDKTQGESGEASSKDSQSNPRGLHNGTNEVIYIKVEKDWKKWHPIEPNETWDKPFDAVKAHGVIIKVNDLQSRFSLTRISITVVDITKENPTGFVYKTSSMNFNAFVNFAWYMHGFGNEPRTFLPANTPGWE